jgi:CPA2 family monovalent cation:H+ antiporter-2
MSSTAIVSKLIAERMELDSPHGRSIVGVLLFPGSCGDSLAHSGAGAWPAAAEIGAAIGLALAKAAVVLAVLLLAGRE